MQTILSVGDAMDVIYEEAHKVEPDLLVLEIHGCNALNTSGIVVIISVFFFALSPSYVRYVDICQISCLRGIFEECEQKLSTHCQVPSYDYKTY